MTEPVRVLLVEPDDQQAEVYIQALEGRGWLVDRARKFLDASALIREYFYNVVIIEVMLPDLLGTDAWRYLKTLRPEMACIFTTASSSIRETVDAYDRDVLDFMLKPVRMDAVCNLVMQVSRHQHVAAEKLQRDHELKALALWMSNIVHANTRRQVMDTAISHLQVLLPMNWTAVFFSPVGRLYWVSRSTSHLPISGPWTKERTARLEAIAEHALNTGKTISPYPAPDDAIETIEVDQENLIVVPLLIQTRLHGVLMFVNEGPEPYEIVQSETELAVVFGKTMALALDRVQLAQETGSSPLPALDQAPAPA